MKRSRIQTLLYIGMRLALSYFSVGVGQADTVEVAHNGLRPCDVTAHSINAPDLLANGDTDTKHARGPTGSLTAGKYNLQY